MKQSELMEKNMVELYQIARDMEIAGYSKLRKKELVFEIVKTHIEKNNGETMYAEGVLDIMADGYGFLRPFHYYQSKEDIYISHSQIRRFDLRTGDKVYGLVRPPKGVGDHYFAMLRVEKVNGREPDQQIRRLHFDGLTPIYPNKRIHLETKQDEIATRVVDLLAPLGKGQRGLIVSPPKAGKTILLKKIANAIATNHPEIHLFILLIDERPEEVTDLERSVQAEVVSSTFDEPSENHVKVTEMVLERAKRLVEEGLDVVILMDSITRLARAHNLVEPPSGRTLSGGVDPNALFRPKRFFGAARNVEEGGSLTIIATALIETGSRMDEVIFEEFKGTGNMEIHMTRKLTNRRVYPAFDLQSSGTRREELMLPEEDVKNLWVLQKFMSTMNTIEGMEFLIDKMRKTKTNAEFWELMFKKKVVDK